MADTSSIFLCCRKQANVNVATIQQVSLQHHAIKRHVRGCIAVVRCGCLRVYRELCLQDSQELLHAVTILAVVVSEAPAHDE